MIPRLAAMRIEAATLTGTAYVDLPAILVGFAIATFILWRKSGAAKRRTNLITIGCIAAICAARDCCRCLRRPSTRLTLPILRLPPCGAEPDNRQIHVVSAIALTPA
jgi:hypothetical protein